MNEEIEYAEMLEIPVSTVNVVKKRRRQKHGTENAFSPSRATEALQNPLKDSLLAQVNDKLQDGADSPAEITADADLFAESANITFGIQIVDARHKPTALDVMMNELFAACGCRRIVVANKWDKLKKSEMEPNLALIRETLQLPEDVVLLPFSAEKRLGREELLKAISEVIL